MILASFWESGGTYLTVLTPLVAVPLTVLTFYLRGVREQQARWQCVGERRFEAVEQSVAQLRQAIADVVRDYTTKEEWLRECMHARRRIEQLTESAVRMETVMDVGRRGEGRSNDEGGG